MTQRAGRASTVRAGTGQAGTGQAGTGQAGTGQAGTGQEGALQRPPPATRRDAVRNYQRILQAAQDVLGESGADASMEEIAARAGVGVGTVYRRFANKDALIDELLRLALEQLMTAADRALARTDGHGLEDLLRAIGASFAEHARYANLMLERRTDSAASLRMRAAISELTERAAAAGTLDPATTSADILALVWAMRGLVQSSQEMPADAWPRFLDIHLAGLRTPATRRTG